MKLWYNTHIKQGGQFSYCKLWLEDSFCEVGAGGRQAVFQEVFVENRESTFLPGEEFGPYVIVRLLGKGGMGEVYLIEHPKTGDRFALKIMTPPEGKAGHEWRRRFAREAEFAMNIRHPNLIGVYDVGEDPDTHLCYIIMEYVPGGTLSDKLKANGKFAVKDAVAIAAQVASALDVAHKEGVVHRDIKPDNIMFDANGIPKIADLGIAKFENSEETTTVTKTGAIIGTPAYMSPEQMMDSHHVDARADIYSLGIVLYEMLTGVRPNADSTIVALLAKAVNGEELPDVRQMRPEVSAAVAYVLSRLVASKPEDRPKTAQEAANLLQSAATGNFKVPREFRCNRTLTELARKRRRRFVIVAGEMLGIAALLCAGIAIAKFSGVAEGTPHGITDKTIRRSTVGDYTWSYWILNGEAVLRGDEQFDKQVGDEQFSSCIKPSPAGKLVVPAQLDGYKVAVLDVNAFNDCDNMTEIELPEGMREVRAYAFTGCDSIAEVTLPKSVRNIISPFRDCQALKRLNLGTCDDLFAERAPCWACPSLECITVDEDNPAFMSCEGALYSKDGKRLILYPGAKTELKLPIGLETIGDGAFQCSRLNKIAFPEGVRFILDDVFDNCKNLEVLELPKSLETIRRGAIKGIGAENLKRVIFHGNAPQDISFMMNYGWRSDVVVEVERGTKGWDGNASSTRLPEKWPMASGSQAYEIRYIGETAEQASARRNRDNEIHIAHVNGFSWTYRLQGDNAILVGKNQNGCCVYPAPSGVLNVPRELDGHKVVEVGVGTFNKCKGLTEVRLPDGITSIGYYAFNECEGMKSLFISRDVNKIDSFAIRFCTSLQEISVDPRNKTFKSVNGALYRQNGDLLMYPKDRDEIQILPETKYAEAIALAHASYRKVNVPEGVRTFGHWQFEACKNLEVVELPKTLEHIYGGTFKDCESLSRVIFHGNAPSYSGLIFENTPENLIVEVPRGSQGWNGPGSTDLPEKWPVNGGADARTIRYIGDSGNSQAGDPNDRSAIIGNTRWHYMLEDGKAVLCHGADSHYGESCIKPHPKGKVVVPEKIDGYPVVALGPRAFKFCEEMTELAIPEGVKEIRGEFCFEGCTGLTEIKLPKSIVKVDGHAFKSCTSLRRIDISHCREISGSAFMGCSSLEAIVAADDNPALTSKDGALYSKNGKTLVAYPKAREDMKLPNGVTSIGECALGYGKYVRVVLPEGVKNVSDWAFEFCNELETVEFPSSLANLRNWVFKECNALRKVVFHGNAPSAQAWTFTESPNEIVVEVEHGSTGWTADGSTALPRWWPVDADEHSRKIFHIGEASKWMTIPKDAVIHSSIVGGYRWYYSLEDGEAMLWRGSDASSGEACVEPKPRGRIEVPESIDGHPVAALGSLAFFRCTDMTEVVLPKTLKAIGNRAFLFCTSLREIDMPDNVEWIGKWALNHCSSIRRINIGKCGVFSDHGVFSHCRSLEKFEASPGNKSFKVVDGSLYSKDGKRFVAFAGAGRKCNVAKGVESVDGYAFGGSQVEHVFFSASLKLVGEGIFSECKALKTVRFAGSAPAVIGPAWSIFYWASEDAVIEARADSGGWGGFQGISLWPQDNPRKVILVESKGRSKPKKRKSDE